MSDITELSKLLTKYALILYQKIEESKAEKQNKYPLPTDVRYALFNTLPLVFDFYNKSSENSDEIMTLIKQVFEEPAPFKDLETAVMILANLTLEISLLITRKK